MKKIFSLFALSCITFASFAQVTFTMDTSFSIVGRNSTSKPIISINNSSTSPVTFTWSIDTTNSIFPSGYSSNGVCLLPGLCYSFAPNMHTETIDAKSKIDVEPTVFISATADLTKSCYVVINTDIDGGKKMVFKVTAQNWATSINTAKPTRINLDMYPSPVTNTLNVVHNNSKVQKAILFNILGKKIMDYNTPINANGFSINTSDLASGMYIIDVRDGANRSLATQRFTKN
jgi:Secretion system C-terminal sorting domain